MILKIQLISFNAIVLLLDSDILELSQDFSSFFITSESQFYCLLLLIFFSLESSFWSNFPFFGAFPDYSVNSLYLNFTSLYCLCVGEGDLPSPITEVCKSQMLGPDFRVRIQVAPFWANGLAFLGFNFPSIS